jgi:hypothetical protein
VLNKAKAPNIARASVARSFQVFTATSAQNDGHFGTFHGHSLYFISATTYMCTVVFHIKSNYPLNFFA